MPGSFTEFAAQVFCILLFVFGFMQTILNAYQRRLVRFCVSAIGMLVGAELFLRVIE
jgi:hypothetical protein